MGARQWNFTFTEKDLFRGFDEEVISTKTIDKKQKSRKELSSKIFADTFFEILLDIIKNNTTFVCPIGFGEYAEICLQVVDEDEFKKIYKNGGFKNIDFVKSQFKTYTFVFKYKVNGKIKTKPIFLSKELNAILTKYINEGKEYY